MLKVIPIEELKSGMYVDEVVEQSGRLKIKSKGLVKSAKAIDLLKSKGVKKIQVDLSKSLLDDDTSHTLPAAEESVTAPPPASKTTKAQSLSEQLEAAQKVYDSAKRVQSRFVNAIKQRKVGNLDSMQDVSLDIIDSVVEAPGALSCLTHINKTDDYLLEHSLNCAVYMAMFAEHLELDKAVIEDLAFGALLMDTGMANVPADIRTKAGPLTKPEHDVVVTHVDIGCDIVERCGDVSDQVREIIFRHHERVDGSGYPDALKAEELSMYVKMAAIVDSYDAMTTSRPYKKGRTPAQALKAMLQDPAYDRELVNQFIQCLSPHPVGSLVQLDNDRLAMVVRANKSNPLEPKVIAFFNARSGHYLEPKLTDLSRANVSIEAAVRPEEFGINLLKFFKDVLVHKL